MNYHILTFRFREQDSPEMLKSFTSQAITEDEVEAFVDHTHTKMISRGRSLEEIYTHSFNDDSGVAIWLELLHDREVPFGQKIHRFREKVALNRQTLYQTVWMLASALARKTDYERRNAEARSIRNAY
jgi:hypothetical protein